MTDASVRLWGRRTGAVSWDAGQGIGVFQYDPRFVGAGIEVSPVTMPVRELPYTFPGLGRDAFKGLPGLLADSLPDRFGNALIDVWLAESDRAEEDFSPVDRLCYIGRRAVGALEFEPGMRRRDRPRKLEIGRLVDLANRALEARARLAGRLGGQDDTAALEDILGVGTSAGGARAKAVLAWNPDTGEFRSGQVEAGDGFEDWLLKFDGVADSQDRELSAPKGYGRIEYAYYLYNPRGPWTREHQMSAGASGTASNAPTSRASRRAPGSGKRSRPAWSTRSSPRSPCGRGSRRKPGSRSGASSASKGRTEFGCVKPISVIRNFPTTPGRSPP